MPRHPRIHAAGLLFHVMGRGNNGQKVFLDADDYEVFLKTLQQTRQRYPYYLYAYVLMPNHFHLLMEVIKIPTARIMQSLLTGYVRWFNREHGHKGHLFQGRYKAIVCDREGYLLQLVRYIHLNPVRAGLVKRPGDWKWSGHGEYLGKQKRGLIDPGPVIGELRTPASYEAFVREEVKQKYRAEWHPGDHAPFLGAEGFIQKITKSNKTAPSHRTMQIEKLCEEIAKKFKLNPEALRGRGRSTLLVGARHQFIGRAVLEEGYAASKVALFLGCHASNVSRALRSLKSELRQVMQV